MFPNPYIGFVMCRLQITLNFQYYVKVQSFPRDKMIDQNVDKLKQLLDLPQPKNNLYKNK